MNSSGSLDNAVNAKLAQDASMISIIDDESSNETPQIIVDDVEGG